MRMCIYFYIHGPPKDIFYVPRLGRPPAKVSIPQSLPSTTNISPSTDGAGTQIQKWINTCRDTHERCTSVTLLSHSFVPTRLIDISRPNRHLEPVYVVHTQTNLTFAAAEKPPYVALSHCWGKKSMLRLTADTLENFMNPSVGIAWEKLPKTFLQAVEVARALGVKYIWIDSLCIIQETKNDAGDFSQEAQLMHKVYRYSFCNIAAVDSQDSSGGLFRGSGESVAEHQKRSEILPLLVRMNGIARPGRAGTGTENKYAILQDIWTDGLLGKHLYTRGWVFQERMLSPLILHFSSTQVFWDCATTSACETLPETLPHPLDTVAATERHWRQMLLLTREADDTNTASSATTTSLTTSSATTTTRRPPLNRHTTGTADPSLETLWRSAVRKYTTCELTHWNDRLPAIWGVAKLVRDGLRRYNFSEEYAVGLWKTKLEEQLAWQVVGYEATKREVALEMHPSWSWASVRGEIQVPVRFVSERKYWVRGFDGGDVGNGLRVQVGGDGNFEPRLVDRRLEVRGVVFPGRWRLGGCDLGGCGGECRWGLEVDGDGDGVDGERRGFDGASLDVYPDVRPSASGDRCYLVILVLGKPLSAVRAVEEGLDEEGSEEEDLEGEGLEDGTGLILDSYPLDKEFGGVKAYTRLGTFRVQGVDGEEFRRFHDDEAENFYLI